MVSTMNGVDIVAGGNFLQKQTLTLLPGGGRKCRSIVVRPSISRGRGYAVVLEMDGNDGIIIQPAPRTAKLTRIGRFDSFPTAASINNMPDSVMQAIFSYIDEPRDILQCGTVCKEWRRIINSAYVKKSNEKDDRTRPKVKALNTAKVKIFGSSKTVAGIETTSQRKEDSSFREVVVKARMDEASGGSQELLNYLTRLAAYLSPTQTCLLADMELTDELVKFLFTIWQPRLSELRLLRCSFGRISMTTVETMLQSKRLKHLSVDDCPVLSTCPLVDAPTLVQLSQSMTRLELCFCGDESVMSTIDNRFLELLAEGWKTRSDIRWLKLRAPLITTDGVENLIGRYFKLRCGQRYYDSDSKCFIKVPRLILWLCDTAVDVDDFLSRRCGKKWFREDKLPTARRRKLRDAYSGGEDLVIWVEKSSTVTTEECVSA